MRGAGKDPFSWIAVLLRWSHGERAARQDRAHDDVEKGFVGRVLAFASVLCLIRIRGVSRIAVLSDTHNRLPESVVAKINCADEIWHLGDVCFPGTLDSLVGLGVSLSVVHGNCDNPWDWKATMRLERHGRVFHLEHIPPNRPPPGVDCVLHGHTHVPRNEIVLGVRYLNPGCISRPNRGAPASFAWLTVEPEKEIEWDIVLV